MDKQYHSLARVHRKMYIFRNNRHTNTCHRLILDLLTTYDKLILLLHTKLVNRRYNTYRNQNTSCTKLFLFSVVFIVIPDAGSTTINFSTASVYERSRGKTTHGVYLECKFSKLHCVFFCHIRREGYVLYSKHILCIIPRINITYS